MDPLCAVCQRAPRGFGYCLPRTTRQGFNRVLVDPNKRKASYRRFCSKACQDIYDRQITSEKKVDRNYFEQEAANEVLGPLGDFVVAIGTEKSLGDYTKAEIRALVDVVLETYHNKLKELYNEDIPF